MKKSCNLLNPERVHYQECRCSAGTDVVTVLFVEIYQQQCQNFGEAVEQGGQYLVQRQPVCYLPVQPQTHHDKVGKRTHDCGE